ncbi:MAG TPA: GIY-YIG nuclease family protein [Candidatus Absconditabacterales bacterium]|nr:GIY-YIG nuclease family protein [Candidatus Absconditabacterales bacterium]
MYYLYLLKGKRFYLGITNNVARRLQEHLMGEVYSTKRIGSRIVLVGYLTLKSKKDALELELKLKKSGHIDRIIHYKGFVSYGDID